MKKLGQKIASIAILIGGVFVTIAGVAGLFLPIIPGFILILLGLWMIRRVYKNPVLDKIVELVKQKIALHEIHARKKDK